MRSIVVLAGLLTAMMVAGCGYVPDDSAGTGRAIRPSTSPQYDRNELAAQTKKALLAPDALTGLDSPVRSTETIDGDFETAHYCGNIARDEGRTGHVAHERQWSTPSVFIAQVVHGYYRKTGAEAVDLALTGARERCGSYASSYAKAYTDLRAARYDNVKYELLDPVEVATPDGVEASFGQCHTETYLTGQQRIVCAAYLGHKNVVSAVFVSAGMDQPAARTMLLRIVPTVAAVLAAT